MTHDNSTDDNWEWETPEQRQPRRLDREIDLDTEDVGFPMVWVLIGGLAGLLTIGLIALGVAQIVKKSSAPEPTVTVVATQELGLQPTFTATVMSMMDETQSISGTESQATPVPTPPPTLTPTVAPPTNTPVPVPPSQIQVGGYAQVVNTGGSGLSLRAGPGTNNDRLIVADADSVMPVIDGPSQDEQSEVDETGAVYQWWKLRYTDGTEGWGRADFLEPALAPE
jgi:hypothetical protein